jgi:hypothetical protein
MLEYWKDEVTRFAILQCRVIGNIRLDDKIKNG